jgi:hypothetical protein
MRLVDLHHSVSLRAGQPTLKHIFNFIKTARCLRHEEEARASRQTA